MSWTLAMLAFPLAVRAQHPHPEPRPGLSQQSTVTLADGSKLTTVITPESLRPVGDTQLGYVESNMYDMNGEEMVNTLPSTATRPFNLHDGPIRTSTIDKTSPADDLHQTLLDVRDAAIQGWVDAKTIQHGLDILEGNPIPGRVWSGFALLHYTGPERIRRVQPMFDASGKKIGGNVDVHQIWYGGRIESDTALLDPTDVQDVPWTITYTVDVLNGGADDFSPFTMYFDAPPSPNSFVTDHLHGPPHVAFDADFSPMSEGKRHIIRLKHAPGKYFNLIYTWGWRVHPPRVQVMENALKTAGPMTLDQWEISTFGPAPRSSEADKLAAIAKLGELSPAKRIWQSLRDAAAATPSQVVGLMDSALVSYADWTDRRRLPHGVQDDPTADFTLLYVNNTIYGNVNVFSNWLGRGSWYKVTILNGDHFPHGYLNVDFGGSRGWENQFQNAGGAGSSHTFGRCHWWVTAGGPNGPIVADPAAADGTPSRHRVEIQLNFDHPERAKLYQFDPFHHDVAVFTLH